MGCPFPSPCPNRPYSPYHLTSYFHSPSPERHDPSQGQEKENHCGCVKMRLCPCGLDPQSHTISHATRCVPTLIAGSCWVGHGGAHAFFRYIPLSVETLRATSLPSRVYNIFIYQFNYNIYIAPIGMNWRKPTHPTIPPPRRDVACHASTGWGNRGMGRFPPIHPDRCYVYIL